MKGVIHLALAMIASFAPLPSTARATSFSMTTETADSLGFIDIDSVKADGPLVIALTYEVVKLDQPLDVKFRSSPNNFTYAVMARRIIFDCPSERYSIDRIFFYSGHGDLVGSFDGVGVSNAAVPPETGLSEQFRYACKGVPLSNKIDRFPDGETPLQTLIRASRATMSDPRWKP